jgi:pimeloyl-ACP methyl ester carboxylesterase
VFLCLVLLAGSTLRLWLSALIDGARAHMQFLQTAHPPTASHGRGGGRPGVHRGFLSSWTKSGLTACVLQHISQLLDSAADRGAVRIVATGHSLGGAIATLAALDVMRQCKVGPQQVACYTFGCPRVGAHVAHRVLSVQEPVSHAESTCFGTKASTCRCRRWFRASSEFSFEEPHPVTCTR